MPNLEMLFILYKESVSLFSLYARGAGIFSRVDGFLYKEYLLYEFYG